MPSWEGGNHLIYFGARYYDPRTSVWQSPDLILACYLPTAGLTLEKAENQPGQGGVFAPVNLNLYDPEAPARSIRGLSA